MNKRGQNFPVKSPEEINTSRMPDGLGLVQHMRSFSLVPARGWFIDYIQLHRGALAVMAESLLTCTMSR
jgi:hypothetical protein